MRHFFPDIFESRALLSRELDVRLVKLKGVRAFIDEIPANYDWKRYDRSYGFECGIMCGPVKRISK